MVPQKYLNLNIDDLVSDERLKEDTDQPHQPKFEWFELSQTSRRISLTCSACTCPWWSHRWRCSWICRGGWTLWATQPPWSVCSQPGKRVENEKTRSPQPGKEEWIKGSEVTTSILCRDISMLTNTEKYSVMLGEPSWDKTMSKTWLQFSMVQTCMRMRSISMAIMGLFSTKSGNFAGVRPSPETTWGSRSSSVKSRCCSPSVSVLCDIVSLISSICSIS